MDNHERLSLSEFLIINHDTVCIDKALMYLVNVVLNVSVATVIPASDK